MNATRDCEPINWLKALDLAAGKPGTDIETYERQPAEISIYDPDALGFENLLLSKEGFNTFEQIVIDGRQYWLPLALYCCPRIDRALSKLLSYRPSVDLA